MNEHADEPSLRRRRPRKRHRHRHRTIFRPAPFQEDRTPSRDDIRLPPEFIFRLR